METTWYVIADSSRVRIFERQPHTQHLIEIENFVNPAGHANSVDLLTDERGRFFGKGERNQGHTADPHVFPVDHENEKFSKTLTHYLDHGRRIRLYQKLCLIAPPKFLGLIRNNLKKDVQRMVEEELPKDISSYTVPQIERYLQQKIGHA